MAFAVLLTQGAAGATPSYHLEPASNPDRFLPEQIALLEKLNRADAKHLRRQGLLIVPDVWLEENAHSPFPETLLWTWIYKKHLVVHLPSQAFAAYEYGKLVRWGPVSSGRRKNETPAGLFHLNWRAKRRVSTDNPGWILDWYFNFHSGRGLAFHEYALPGLPASHACLRLLRRDAIWLFRWGEGWELSEDRAQVIDSGTPVLITGAYDFTAPRPWADPLWWETPIEIPEPELNQVIQTRELRD